MDIINWALAGLLTGLLAWHFLKTRQLEQLLARHQSHIDELGFRHGETSDFMENQIAKIHYQMLIRLGHLKFTGDTTLVEVLSHQGASEILVKNKLIRRSDPTNQEESLAQRAKDLKIPLEPVLAALNLMETSQ